jgi:hypothetical protein
LCAALAIVTKRSSERLTEHFEDAAVELEHLVEKQHAAVREADFARPRLGSAADDATFEIV